jgi:hypothetical protein
MREIKASNRDAVAGKERKIYLESFTVTTFNKISGCRRKHGEFKVG